MDRKQVTSTLFRATSTFARFDSFWKTFRSQRLPRSGCVFSGSLLLIFSTASLREGFAYAEASGYTQLTDKVRLFPNRYAEVSAYTNHHAT